MHYLQGAWEHRPPPPPPPAMGALECPRLMTKFYEHTKFVGSIRLVLDAIINSVNCSLGYQIS